MLELAQGLGLDLAYALAGDGELLAHLFQGVVGVDADAFCLISTTYLRTVALLWYQWVGDELQTPSFRCAALARRIKG